MDLQTLSQIWRIHYIPTYSAMFSSDLILIFLSRLVNISFTSPIVILFQKYHSVLQWDIVAACEDNKYVCVYVSTYIHRCFWSKQAYQGSQASSDYFYPVWTVVYLFLAPITDVPVPNSLSLGLKYIVSSCFFLLCHPKLKDLYLIQQKSEWIKTNSRMM